jgi:hypothetical protein
LRGLASYTVPKIDVLVSAIVRSQANVQPGADVATNGASRLANFLMDANQFQALTGRSLRTGVTTEQVQLLLPGQIYGDRVNNIDMRFAKIIRFGRTRSDIGLDLNNLFNTNYATGYNTQYAFSPGNALQDGTWGNPTSIYSPRFVRINYTLNF